LIELFLASIPGELEKIKAAADKKDVLVVSKLVHSVKGASGMACIFGMQSVCRKIEESARSGDIEMIREQIQELEREFGEVKDFLLHATKTDSILNEQTL
jgi:HPt (histidine-containing phosphotransfer) domain-containing protein